MTNVLEDWEVMLWPIQMFSSLCW